MNILISTDDWRKELNGPQKKNTNREETHHVFSDLEFSGYIMLYFADL